MPLAALLFGFSISATPETVMILDSPQQVQRICGSIVPACTQFQAISLRLGCEQSDSWRMRGDASIAPFMVTHHEFLLAHEREHVADVVQRIRIWGEQLTALRFSTREECTAAAASEEAAFRARIHNFARLSQQSLR
jgi:hypothetical protein